MPPMHRSIAHLAVLLGLPAVHLNVLLSKRLPLRESASATEVLELQRLLRQHGYAITTEPRFPWTLTEE